MLNRSEELWFRCGLASGVSAKLRQDSSIKTEFAEQPKYSAAGW